MGVGGQRHAPAALPPGKTRYPLYRRLGGPQGRSGQAQKISPPTGIQSPDRPAHSESLYRLSYPGSNFCNSYWGSLITESGVDSASNRNEYLGGEGGRCVWLTASPSACTDCLQILWTLTYWNRLDLSTPLCGLLYVCLWFIDLWSPRLM